ncbi:ATP-binding protein [Synechococcus sp. BDU 130192]|uniref:ATP-binding protein n=1 Tax=Synechococcus sp. BDU 130192 TaxID=2042059 RepID=UPI000C06CA69|nr:ATP-binding protein [Synechococcus sp. BDU 130192]
MNLKELRTKAQSVMNEIRDKGSFPKENNLLDYKEKLSIKTSAPPEEVFMSNLAKDIISFANSDGGIIILGVREEKKKGQYEDVGLDSENVELINKIDLNNIIQKFTSVTKSSGINLDLKDYKIGARNFFYLIVEKSYQIVLPIRDFSEYSLVKGCIYYRVSAKNEQANLSTSHFNSFLQLKANERSREFMEIWSNLLPEMVDINPREVLIVNPSQDKVYGFNSRENKLSGSDVDIEKEEDGVFNIILKAISAGEIGRITTDEGKPIYKIVGQIRQDNRDRVSLASLERAVKDKADYKFTNAQLKICLHHLGWVSSPNFQVEDPPAGTVIQDKFEKYIYIGDVDSLKGKKKIFFSNLAVDQVVPIINNASIHEELFQRQLVPKNQQ